MKLLCGNSNRVWHYLQGKTGRCGMLLSPSYYRKIPLDHWMPFALDNGAFIAWRDGVPWDEAGWLEMLTHIARNKRRPLWAAVPDVVANREATLEKWPKYVDVIKRRGWDAAFCVQDGMTPDDVPTDPAPDIIFVGGSDNWKFRHLAVWASRYRCHCARVNSQEMIEACEQLGCESVDGTGWFRDPSREDKIPMLERFLNGQRTNDGVRLAL